MQTQLRLLNASRSSVLSFVTQMQAVRDVAVLAFSKA